MDKLRALRYFVAAAHARSFSGAARGLDVSVPAVARLISALERSLDVRLFERSPHGLTLTPEGATYLEAGEPLLQRVGELDEAVTGASGRPRGTLVVGAPPYLSQHCLLPELSRFHSRFPEIQVDVRSVDRATSPEAAQAEVLLLYGWPEHSAMVHRRIAHTRSLICAAPAYWAKHGVPERPADLARHDTLLFRDQEGTILDRWEYERHGEKDAVVVSGWLVSSHRDLILDAALAGHGVARFSDLTIRPWLENGRLVPVLLDWTTRESPPVNLMYRASQRRIPRVRVFVEFVTELFRRLEAQRGSAPDEAPMAERPPWYGRRRRTASASARSGPRPSAPARPPAAVR